MQDVVELRSEIQLQENVEVVNVSPRVTLDPVGGFVVADPREAQVRLYSPTGALTGHFGRRGKGPGEFERVNAAVRLASGEILAVDMGGRLTRFDSLGTGVRGTQDTPLLPIYDIAVVDDSLIALTGRFQGEAHSPLVHLWNIRSGTLVRSFFSPAAPERGLQTAYTFTGFADVAARGDTLAVVFALSDTVHLFDLQGRERKKLRIPFRSFRPLREPMPPQSSTDDFQRWIESFSAISQIYWNGSGIFVQFFDMSGSEAQWRLLRMDTGGRPIFEVRDNPRLLAVSSTDETLVFVSPTSETPNVWALARVRS
ncbi:MAG TPA: hypothetical protein VHG28_21655 [Longimicrobiaceae bacterium]|nr:hypothetical protein [Longimicrobiaceae bacterium]